jgi:transcriptional regulator with XRE-family HTH domain
MPPRLGRTAAPTTSPLGLAMRERRGEITASSVAASLGLSLSTFTRIELGNIGTSYVAAKAIAAWLGEGWDIDRVMRESQRVCAFPNCQKRAIASGFCRLHDAQQARESAGGGA